MNDYINYLLEANFGLLLFLLLYLLILNRETDFSFKRSYLLCSMMISIVFPLFTVGSQQNAIPSISRMLPSYILPEVLIKAENAGEELVNVPVSTLNVWGILLWIYLSGLLLLSIRFFIRLARLIYYIKKSTPCHLRNRYHVVELNNPLPTFSFFNYIFIGQGDQLTSEDKKLIIEHEIVHVDKFHSADILLVEMLSIVFWFNPSLFLYKKIITNLHEFQADQRALEDHDVNQYCNLLARVALMSADFKLANHFNNSLTLKRITMIKTIKKKLSTWKMAVILPIAAIFFFIVACQEQVTTGATEIAKTSAIPPDLPKEVQDRYNDLQKAHPEKKFSVVETDAEGKAKMNNITFATLEDLRKNGNQNFSSINVITPTAAYGSRRVRTFFILEYNTQIHQISENVKSSEEIFTVVDESASYVGGMDSLIAFIQKNLRYPEESRKSGKEGKVFVQFVVNADGSLTDFTILNGVDSKIDAEALRIAHLLPSWNPGRQQGQAVRQQLVLPISFKRKQ